MGKAKFSVNCPEMGFSRSAEIPIDARGYVHRLAEDLDRALEFYEQRIEIHRLKQEIDALRNYGNKDCTSQADEYLKEVNKEQT